MMNRSGSTKRRLNETQHRESKTHKMGMQISCGVHPEVSQEKHLWVGEKRVRADHPGSSSAERERSGGGHLMADHVKRRWRIQPKYWAWGGGGLTKARSPIAMEGRLMNGKLGGTELLGEGLLRVNGGAG